MLLSGWWRRIVEMGGVGGGRGSNLGLGLGFRVEGPKSRVGYGTILLAGRRAGGAEVGCGASWPGPGR
jgi:hypothetical protein